MSFPYIFTLSSLSEYDNSIQKYLNSIQANRKDYEMSCLKLKCSDAATENCPCYLAETQDCLMCSRLNGSDRCECNWTGVCVLSQFMFNNRKISNPRSERNLYITNTEFIMPDFALITLSASADFIYQCNFPGTYIFLRCADAPPFYDTPLSVMSADLSKLTLTLGIRVISAKTKLLTESQTAVIARGPYRNGIEGFDPHIKNADIQIWAKGAGVCPAIFAFTKLRGKNTVKLKIHDGELEKILAERYLGKDDYEITEDEFDYGDAFSKGFGIDKKETQVGTESEKIIILMGCSQFIQTARKRLQPSDPAPAIYESRNHVICCGEGVCGACGKTQTPDGPVPACKVR